MKHRYIDIHSHILFGVDDGASTMEMSVQMLKEAAAQGITDIIATPHYRNGMFEYPKSVIIKNYRTLKEEAHRYGLRLSLGCEYHVDGDLFDHIQSRRIATLAGSKYVLTEYSMASDYSMIRLCSQNLLRQGLVPVIAHVERIDKLLKHPEYMRELSNMGALLQVNAGSFFGEGGSVRRRNVMKWMDEELVDLIASDAHNLDTRRIRIKEAADFVKKGWGEERCRRLFTENPARILNREQQMRG